VNWLEVVLILAVVLGLFSGAVLVARSPTFWFGLGTVMLKAALPYLLKRMPPEQEKAMQDCLRRGGEWDNFKKRCKR
jgi:hypothetical protein